MKKLDKRGVAALEFCLVAVPLFILMFAIFDLGRYAITMQSLRALASAGARAMMINCYTPDVINNQPFTNCLVDPLPSDAAKQAVAPFLYAGGLTPVLTVAIASTNIPPPPAKGALIVKASLDGFKMMFPKIWGTVLNAPSASTQIPF
jgi:hypothetical protein